MPFRTDVEIDLTPEVECKYIIHSHHRKATGSPHKCYWTITNAEEVECFKQAMIEEWQAGQEAWGLKMGVDILQVVGLNQGKEELKLAKFVDGTATNVWHGYPADYMNRAGDRPATFVLVEWVKKGYITKAKMNKIRVGQLCSL